MNESGGLSVADVAALNGNGGLGNNGLEGLIYLAVIASMFGGGNWFGNNNDSTNDALLAATIAGNNGFQNAIGYENLATSAEVQRGFDNQNSMANQREILSAVNGGTMQTINAENQGFHDMYAVISDKYGELQRDIAANAVSIANLAGQTKDCCCDTKMLVMDKAANTDAQVAQSRYDTALGIADVNANIAQNKYENALGLAAVNANIAQNKYEAALNTASIKEELTAQIQSVKDMLAQDKIETLQNELNNVKFQSELQNATVGIVRYPMSTTYGVPSPCFNWGGGSCNNCMNI